MVSLISAIIGLCGSFLPDLLGYFKTRQKNKQSIELMKLDYEQEILLLEKRKELNFQEHELRIQETELKGDLDVEKIVVKAGNQQVKGGKIATAVNALNMSIRPVLTYFFFFFFVTVHLAPLFCSPATVALLSGLYTPEINAIFVAMISFFFGNRSLKYAMGRIDSTRH